MSSKGSQAAYWVGMIVSICAALTGVADTFPKPYDRILGLLGVIGTAASAYRIQSQRDEWSEDERHRHRRRRRVLPMPEPLPPPPPPPPPPPGRDPGDAVFPGDD